MSYFYLIIWQQALPPSFNLVTLVCRGMYTVSSARRDTGKWNWLNSSRQDLHRVNPIGPKLLYTSAKGKGTVILRMEREFLREKKKFLLFGEALALAHSSMTPFLLPESGPEWTCLENKSWDSWSTPTELVLVSSRIPRLGLWCVGSLSTCVPNSLNEKQPLTLETEGPKC